ncbi:MAG: endonuclease/exonuclease/phosphatase family protein, partial [Pseudomonadota bacterium]
LSWSSADDTYKVKVNGRSDWDGFIALKRDNFDFLTVSNTGRFMRKIDADVFGICEVESVGAMRQFRSDQLSRMDLDYELLVDGNDPRGIDIGMYSRFPYGFIRTNIHHKTSSRARRTFSRDCLEVEIQLPSGNSLWVLQNHLKSKLGAQSSSDARRKKQADRIAEILHNEYDLNNVFVIVSGDLNDTPDRNPLSALTDNSGLHDVLEVAGVPENQRWTYEYRGQLNQIDYILISSALSQHVTDAGVDRTGMADLESFTNGAEHSLSGITNWRNAASDHGAVWAEFDI